MIRQFPFFYGWCIAFAAMVCMAMGVTIVTFTFGNFIGPVTETFNWSRSEISLGSSLALFGLMVGQPLVGRLVDRFGTRQVIAVAAMAFGACWVALYFLSASLTLFCLLYFLLGFFGGGVGPVTFAPVLSRWFEKKRALAMAIATTGFGLGGAIMAGVSQGLISEYGWRMTYLIIGILVWVVVIPLVLIVVREFPETYGLGPDGSVPVTEEEQIKRNETGISRQQALQTRSFWNMAGAFLLWGIVMNGLVTHLVPLLTDRGVAAEAAATILAIIGIVGALGRILIGYIADRVQARIPMGGRYVASACFVIAALGILILQFGEFKYSAFVFAALFGLALGAETDLFPYMASRCFGVRALGAIYGLVAAAFGLGGFAGPMLAGAGFDNLGSYDVTLIGFFLLVIMAALLTLMLRDETSPGQPAR